MCLAHPAKVVEIIDANTAYVLLGKVKKEISLALVENVKLNDYVLVHVGYALNKLSELEAKKTLKLMAEAGLDPGVTYEIH